MKRCPKCGGACLPTQSFCPACGSALKAAALIEGDPYLGTVFANKYTVEEKLGEGGMGVVYRARTLEVGRSVALKVLHERYSGDRAAILRFTREAKVASRLNHPNSISIFDFGHTASGLSYLVMELLQGKSLQEVLSDEDMSLARAIHIMRQILSALEAAHALGIVHRDLKPANIHLLSSRSTPDHVKVLDFGIAHLRRAGSMERVTRTGMVCGTPEYMSPEQAKGQETDARSDIYSAGLVFYEMLTGRRPFEGGSPAEVMAAQIHDVPVAPSVRSVERAIPPSLDAIVMWSLAKAPDERFPSVREFHRVLKEWVQVSGEDWLKETSPVTCPNCGGKVESSYGGKSCPSCRFKVRLPKRAPHDVSSDGPTKSVSIHSEDIIEARDFGEVETSSGSALSPGGSDPQKGRRETPENVPPLEAELKLPSVVPRDAQRYAPAWKSLSPSSCPLFGRRAQMSYLESEVAKGGFQAYRFSGPVGVGKSRTAQELMARAAAEGRRPIRSPLPAGSVFEPLEVVQSLAVQLLEFPCEPVDRDDLAAQLEFAGYPEELQEGMALLFRLEPATTKEADPEELRVRRAQGWRSLVVEAAKRQPLVLLFDEIERMDGASKELLLALAAVETDAPITLLMTHEDSYFTLWPDSVQEVVVRPLELTEGREFAKYLAQGELSDAQAKAIAERCEGNPLHIRERVAFRCLHPMDSPPDALPDLLAARFNRVPGEARLRLQIASILSETVRQDTIATVESSMGTPFPEVEGSVEKSLKILSNMGFVVKEGTHRSFLHSLHRQVVTSGIPAGVRVDFHKRAARLLGPQGAGRLSLAHHFWELGRDEESIQHVLSAGSLALDALDEEDAEFCYRRVLEAIKGPDATLSGSQGEIWLEAVGGLAEALERSGNSEEAQQLLGVARKRVSRIGWKAAQERLQAPLEGEEQGELEP